jgi:cbb3-type cytochrome oxidase subunit 3
MKKYSSSPSVQFAVLILAWSLMFGALVRALPVLQSSFPLNDGGLFYTMAQDILNAGYKLPLYTTYNHAGIPFVYPPLGLYLLAFLSRLFPLLQLVRWLPVVYATLSILAFYSLACTVFKDSLKASFAALAFAMIPSAAGILIQGGGVTRALGYLFCLLALNQALRLFQTAHRKYILTTALFAALVLLSHPSAAFMTALFIGFFWLVYGRSRSGLLSALAVALLVLVLSTPWWLPVYLRHGWQPLLSGFDSGWYTALFILPYLRLNTIAEAFATLVMVIAILGGLYSLYRKQYFLPLWFLVSLISQRDGSVYASIPVSLLFAVALFDLILPAFSHWKDAAPLQPNPGLNLLASSGTRLLVAFLLIYNLLNAVVADQKVSIARVTAPEQAAMQWMRTNTPANSKVLLLTFGDSLNLPFLEWFPSLTGRVSLTTVQGYEWLPGSSFYNRKDAFQGLQPCLTEDLACVEKWAAGQGLDYDYLLVDHGYVGDQQLDPVKPPLNDWVAYQLRQSPQFRPVYSTPLIEIFQASPR